MCHRRFFYTTDVAPSQQRKRAVGQCAQVAPDDHLRAGFFAPEWIPFRIKQHHRSIFNKVGSSAGQYIAIGQGLHI